MGSTDIIKPLLSTALSSSTVDKPRQHQKTLGMPGIKPRTAGCEARTLPLCHAVPLLNEEFFYLKNYNNTDIRTKHRVSVNPSSLLLHLYRMRLHGDRKRELFRIRCRKIRWRKMKQINRSGSFRFFSVLSEKSAIYLSFWKLESSRYNEVEMMLLWLSVVVQHRPSVDYHYPVTAVCSDDEGTHISQKNSW